MSKELVNEFADVINKSYKHCNEHRKINVNCSGCCFNWRFNLGNHGCFLVELDNSEMIDNLESAMRYHKIDTSKTDNLILEDEE